MPAHVSGNHFRINKVPSGELVYLAAVGSEEGEYYFAKKQITIASEVVAEVAINRISYNNMKKKFETIGYEK